MKASLVRSLTVTLILLMVAVLISGTCALAEDDITSSNPVEDSVTETTVAEYKKRISDLERVVIPLWVLVAVMGFIIYYQRREVVYVNEMLEDAKKQGYVIRKIEDSDWVIE